MTPEFGYAWIVRDAEGDVVVKSFSPTIEKAKAHAMNLVMQRRGRDA